MTVNAKQFPIAAVGRIVAVVVVDVMNGQFSQVGAGKFAGAAAAYPRVKFESLLSIPFFALRDVLALLGKHPV